MNPDVPFLELRTSYDHEPLPSRVMDEFDSWESDGKLGFMALPDDPDLMRASVGAAEELRSLSDGMVVAGIGGSSLGTRALLDALTSDPPVFVADSPDSRRLDRMKERLDPERTSAAIITKSGGTAETMAVFLSLWDWMGNTDPAGRIVAVTDPEKGDLRKLAVEMGWHTLPVPPSVGGRFSVLSPVGLLPAAFAGIDVESLLRGASRVVSDFRENRSGSIAATAASAFLQNFFRYPIHAFFAYDDGLYSTSLWFSQLWAESLGKKLDLQGNTVHTGQTPLSCRGPADQHSLVQLFMEGPADKTVTILTTPAAGDETGLPGGFQDYSSISYLEGLTPDGLRLAEASSTGRALEERGVPVTYIHMGSMDGMSLGGLMMTLEIATVLCGLALGIDPLDQPGVERGKILTYKALGRPGYRDR